MKPLLKNDKLSYLVEAVLSYRTPLQTEYLSLRQYACEAYLNLLTNANRFKRIAIFDTLAVVVFVIRHGT